MDELDACLSRNLGELDAEDRHIIEACDLNRQTVRSYAEANDLSLAAGKSRLLRARKRLRDSLVRNCQVRFDDVGQVCCYIPRNSGDSFAGRLVCSTHGSARTTLPAERHPGDETMHSRVPAGPNQDNCILSVCNKTHAMQPPWT